MTSERTTINIKPRIGKIEEFDINMTRSALVLENVVRKINKGKLRQDYNWKLIIQSRSIQLFRNDIDK